MTPERVLTLETDHDISMRDQRLSPRYEALKQVYEQDEYYSEGDFSERVSILLDDIGSAIRAEFGDTAGTILTQRQVSELIYKHPIHNLRSAVADYLREKGETWVLIDNLDKGWPSSGVTAGDVSLVLCLSEALEKVARSLRQKGYNNFFSTIFLRADVYDNLVDATSDRGKLVPVSVDWSDSEALKELLRKRFVFSKFGDNLDIDHIWAEIAEQEIDGKNSLDVLISHSLFRPRALIDLISMCRSIAINRRHVRITSDDMKEAIRRSSIQMIENISLELRDIGPNYSELLYSFMSREPTLNRAELKRVLGKFSNVPATKVDESEVLHLLLWFGFFGIENDSGRPTFIFDVDYNMTMLRALATNKGAHARFTIHPVFRPSLSIADTNNGPRIRTLF